MQPGVFPGCSLWLSDVCGFLWSYPAEHGSGDPAVSQVRNARALKASSDKLTCCWSSSLLLTPADEWLKTWSGQIRSSRLWWKQEAWCGLGAAIAWTPWAGARLPCPIVVPITPPTSLGSPGTLPIAPCASSAELSWGEQCSAGELWSDLHIPLALHSPPLLLSSKNQLSDWFLESTKVWMTGSAGWGWSYSVSVRREGRKMLGWLKCFSFPC